jgi:hypothetical protein
MAISGILNKKNESLFVCYLIFQFYIIWKRQERFFASSTKQRKGVKHDYRQTKKDD